MAGDRISTEHKGIRYREHATRLYQEPGKKKRPDRYYFIRHAVDGKVIEEGVGWESEGFTIQKVLLMRAQLQEAKRTGQGHRSLGERHEAAKAAEDERRQEVMTFADLAGRYLEWARASRKSTLPHDERRLRLHVLPVLGPMLLKDVRAPHVETLKVRGQEAGLAPASVAHNLQLVRLLFNWAARMDLYQGPNPTRLVRFPKLNNRRLRFLSYDEAERLLDALAERSQDMADMALVSLYAGLRFGEIRDLSWQDVDLEHGTIAVLDPKSGESRHAYLSERLKDMFERRKADRGDSQLVFPGRFGGKIDKVPRTFDRVVSELGFNNGVTDRRQKIVFHSLRHSFASWLALQGTPLLAIKELMGHKTVEMTMRYAHLIPDQKRSAVETLDQRASARKVVPLAAAGWRRNA
ncbi:MAG: site-specific integrase [Desulfarculus sp.]|nr:site-specific integrase [Desulfarculus sp.]